MKIIEKTYAWNGELSKRYLTKYIVLHHRAGNGDADSIHKQHVNNGWVGIGYHFYVRKDGSIYRGRPINTWGSHCIGYNDKTVGICFEGNFQDEKMPKVQLEAGQKLVDYLKGLYPEAEMRKHTELYPTACPGVNFPFNEIAKGTKKMTTAEAVTILMEKAELENKTIDFMLCYKYGEELVKKLAEAMI